MFWLSPLTENALKWANTLFQAFQTQANTYLKQFVVCSKIHIFGLVSSYFNSLNICSNKKLKVKKETRKNLHFI